MSACRSTERRFMSALSNVVPRSAWLCMPEFRGAGSRSSTTLRLRLRGRSIVGIAGRDIAMSEAEALDVALELADVWICSECRRSEHRHLRLGCAAWELWLSDDGPTMTWNAKQNVRCCQCGPRS